MRMPLNALDALAVCNDGTEASYYFKDNGNRKLWVVYLAGGGWCYDEESCAGRFNGTSYPHHDCSNSSSASPCFMSSKDYREVCGKTGMFDASTADGEQSAVASANKIYVPYCSSDGHMGDAEFGGFQFRGARIARAVIKDLLANHGLGSEGATLLFGGGSAGGRGAMVLLDEMAETLRQYQVQVLGFLDSPYYIDVPSLSTGFAGFQPQHTAVLKNFNAKSVISKRCAAKYRGEKWKCLFGAFRMPMLETPYILLSAQYDGWQLSHLVHAYEGIEKEPTYSDAEFSYVDKFGAQTLVDLKRLKFPRGSLVYSTACYNHHITEKPSFFTVKTTGGVSQNMALGLFLNGTVAYDLIDDCRGFKCGGGCSDGESIAMRV